MKTEDAIREVINVSAASGCSCSSITAALLWSAAEFMCANEGKMKAKLTLLMMMNAIDDGAFDAVATPDIQH